MTEVQIFDWSSLAYEFRDRNCLAFSASIWGGGFCLLTNLIQWQDSLNLGRGFRCWVSGNKKKSSKEHCGKKKVWGKFLNVLKLSFPISNKGIKITVKFYEQQNSSTWHIWCLKKWQSFFKGDNLFFWTSFFHEEIFISLPRKEQYL